MNCKHNLDMNYIAYFLPAKVMKKRRKNHQKQASKHKEEANPKVMYDILTMFEHSEWCLQNRFMLVCGNKHESLISEVFDNYKAYKKAFRKLGYKLKYQSDCRGQGFSISF